jgi:elongation factor Ts
MAEITAALVKELRERTGLGMMECKKALEEAGGDIAKAEELLRIKSGAKASKAAGRVAADGAIGTFLEGNVGALVEINAETDFVAKNPDFAEFARNVAQLVAKQKPSDVAALSGLKLGGNSAIGGLTVEEARQKLVQKIGENITVRRFERVEAKGKLLDYVHPGSKVAVIVDYEGDAEVAKDVTHHIAFAKPQYMTKAEFPADKIAAERKILEARAAESGKPPEIVAKMVEGGVNKFVSENTLMGQPFVKDDKQTVEKMLGAKKTKLHQYKVLVVGAGIEKKQSDFAAEVAAMTKNAA